MPINLELKARIDSTLKTVGILRKIARESVTLNQTDTYFRVRRGRLKLREFSKGKSQLIFYVRNEKSGYRWSKYKILTISDGRKMKEFLTQSLGTTVIVEKTRRVFYYRDEARIHVDRVRGIGSFLEMEIFCKRNRKNAVVLYNELVNKLGIVKNKLVRVSYADLIRG